MKTFDECWPFVPLGVLSPAQRGEYYDDLAENLQLDETQIAAFFGASDSQGWESQHFRIGILDSSKNIFENADGYTKGVSLKGKANVYMSKFYAGAMPGKRFALQLFIASQHTFDNSAGELVGHSYAVDGTLGDYVNLSNEPVFRKLEIDVLLKARIGINFITNKDSVKLVELLKSDVLSRGIELTRSYNPVFGAALTYIRGMTTSLLATKGNQSIISHDITFTGNPGPTAPTLCEATYIFAQVPKIQLDKFDWSRLIWDPKTSRVLNGDVPLAWNHLLMRFEKAGD